MLAGIRTLVFLCLLIVLGHSYAARVENIRLVSRDYESLTVEWDPGDPQDRQFEVRYQANNGPWHPLGKTAETRKQLSELKPGVRYRFKVQAESGGGWTYSDNFRTRLYTPAVVRGFKLVQPVTANSITLAWDMPAADSIVDSYQLQYREVDQQEWQTVTPIAADKTRYQLQNLAAASEYELRLSAANEDASSIWVSLLARTQLAVPWDFKVVGVEDTSVKVNNPSLPGEQYDLAYRMAGDDKWHTVKGLNLPVYQIDALREDTLYQLRVRRRMGEYFSEWTDIHTVRTSLPPAPADIAIPVASRIATDHARLLWSPKNNHGDVEIYEVQWKVRDVREWSRATLQDAAYRIDELQPRTDYDVRVRAINRGIKGSWSPLITFTTLALSPPTLQIDSLEKLTPQSLRISWPAANSEPMTAVEIQHKEAGSKWETAIQKDIHSTLNERVIIGLQANTPYSVRLRAINFDRQGEWSNAREVVTSRKPAFSRRVDDNGE